MPPALRQALVLRELHRPAVFHGYDHADRIFFYARRRSINYGAAEAVCALVWFFVLAQSLGKRLSRFACELCDTLDNMMDGGEAPETSDNSEALLARISHRLTRLYKIMQENRRRVEEERRELQALVSDISHQVKTPVGNLKVAADTLLTRTLTDAERSGFIKGIRSQADKLDFLVQALVKTSRLETGVICLEKKTALFMIPSPRR